MNMKFMTDFFCLFVDTKVTEIKKFDFLPKL